jgi:RNA polymerase sigma-70 factor (ECF subfamily)
MSHLEFNQYYSQNEAALYNFATKLTRNRMDAEDLVQETAIKIYKNLHRFLEGSNFKNWSFTILKNTFITKYNKRKKRAVLNTSVEDMMFAIDDIHITNNAAASKMNIDNINACIQLLSKKSREPFELYIRGYKYEEISQMLDIPMGTVKSRINFARKKLKQALISNGLVEL